MRIAVIGGGIGGVGAALELAKGGIHVTLFEKQDYLGGLQIKAVNVEGIDLQLDLGFMVFNKVTCPNLTEFFDSLGIDGEAFDLSFSVSLDKDQGCEWGTRNGLSSVFLQKSNVLKPSFWRMLHEINKFKDDADLYIEVLEKNPDIDRMETLGQFIMTRNYSELFQKSYLVPLCASIWSCSSDIVMDYSAFSVLSYFRNHHLLQLYGSSQCLTVRGRPQQFAIKLREELEGRGCQIRTSCEVYSVKANDTGCTLVCCDGSEGAYDGCIVAVPAPEALKLLGKQATHDEIEVLGAFQYVYSDTFLHCDKKFMPLNLTAWSAYNVLESEENQMYSTYWLNVVQTIPEISVPLLVTTNPPSMPEKCFLKWSSGQCLPTVGAVTASLELDNIQGKRGIWFCGAYRGYDFLEDRLKAGLVAAHAIRRSSFSPLPLLKHMKLSWTETAARMFLTRYLRSFIYVGCIIFVEDGGAVLKFEGSNRSCTWKSVLNIHNPQFYWKVATEADFGFADAYINGDISFADKKEGLLNFFRIILANQYKLYSSTSMVNKKSLDFKGWWTPMFFTAGIASAKYFYKHVCRRNTVKASRQHIASHYDLSNEMFSLFLDETMTYSCAIFKSENEALKVAQLRKLHLLIEKARVKEHHEVLDIGCGWGSLAIEIVRKTGCRYTGITLAKEQLTLAEQRVKEAGLEDHIQFLLCDYRQLPAASKYDRIISIGMIEHVGHDYYEDFFRLSESVLAENGLLVLQTISVPDELYDGFRRSSGFVYEYIFPGGCLPSLSRITSAMVSASRLCVEHVENIGVHYAQTLRCWRQNFLNNRSKIMSLGFDEKFIRAWEDYFDYTASAFKVRTLGDYQIVFSRLGNLVAFSDPYDNIPSAYCCR